MINVTPVAVAKLKEILAQEQAEDSALRILVVPSGGSVQYMLALEKEPKEDDLVMDAGGLTILVDQESAPLLEGSEIDYVEEPLRTGFIIANPNLSDIGGGCACGGDCDCGGH